MAWGSSLGQDLGLAWMGLYLFACPLEGCFSGPGMLVVRFMASSGADGQLQQVGARWSPLTALPTCHSPAPVTSWLTH